MKAVILAAGRGQRLRPLTDTCPKPLIEVGGKPLIVHHLEALAAAGFRDIIINTAWLAEQFPQRLGDGSAFGLSITYSFEGGRALETGGGLLNALPLVGREPFLVVNADVATDLRFDSLALAENDLAHLVLVTPPHANQGDFVLHQQHRVIAEGEGHRLTYSGIAVLHPQLFAGWHAAFPRHEVQGLPASFRLAPLLRHAMTQGKVSGQHYQGRWSDAGTPDALRALDNDLRP